MTDQSKRTYILGSEWLYFKIYTGTKTADTILIQSLYSWVNELLYNNIIDKWFFIRYYDPDFHIRLRVHLTACRDFSTIFNNFLKTIEQYVDSGQIWNIQCDTYQQELERYGVNTMSIIEDYFCIDSNAIIHLLQGLVRNNIEKQRWNLSLILIDSFLSAFSFDVIQRKKLLDTMSENFKKEFGMTNHNMKQQLDNKFRINRAAIVEVMQWSNNTVLTGYLEIVKIRQEAIRLIAENLICLERTNELQISLNSLLISMIHMTMNRLFRSKNRLHELVIYDFLSRYYTSTVVQTSHNKNH